MVGRTRVLPISALPQHPADLVAAYMDMLRASPTTLFNHPLLMFTSSKGPQTVTVKMLSQALDIMLEALKIDTSLYSLNTLKEEGATTADRHGAQQIDIKRHSL